MIKLLKKLINCSLDLTLKEDTYKFTSWPDFWQEIARDAHEDEHRDLYKNRKAEFMKNKMEEGDKVEIREDCLKNINKGYKSAIGRVGYIHYIDPVTKEVLVNDIGEEPGRLGWYTFAQLKFIEAGKKVDTSILVNYSKPKPLVPATKRYGTSWACDNGVSWNYDKGIKMSKRKILIDQIIITVKEIQPFDSPTYTFLVSSTKTDKSGAGNTVSFYLSGLMVEGQKVDEDFLKGIEDCTFEQLLEVYKNLIRFQAQHRK